MLRLLFLIHRWFGITLGIVMLLWCLSGFVMMYKPYPELTEQQKSALLPELGLSGCCAMPASDPALEQPFSSFYLQMLVGTPVLALRTSDNRIVTVNLADGRIFPDVSQADVARVAGQFDGNARLVGSLHNDQWTVYGGYNAHRPLYKFAADDAAGTEWYISSRTGEIIQLTTREQRFWGWLGAVVHWLYPTLLRERVQLWSQTVIWLTIVGIFLTLTGLYFGIRQYKTRKSGRKSPYRGLSAWHHYAGLLFGVLTLSWVFSGLFSMNPWGLLEGEGMRSEQRLLRGGNLLLSDITPILERLDLLRLDPGVVRLEGEKLLGELHLYAVTRAGAHVRLSPVTLDKDPPDAGKLERIAAVLSPAAPARSAELITEEDRYYYNHHEQVSLPAWRVVSGDASGTRYYIDPQTGRLLSKIDPEKRWYRWLFYGLHRGDFTPFLRSRPVWDIFMWTLLLGVTATSVTGFFMGVRRLARNARRRNAAA